MNKKGNPAGLLKAVRVNPRMTTATKRKATGKLRRQVKRMRMPRVSPHRNPVSDAFQTAQRAMITTLLWFFGLSAVGILASLNQQATAFFSLSQSVLLLKDIGDANKSRRLLSNLVAALVNGLIGWATGDGWYTLGAIVVGLIVIMKAMDKL
jgi:hypothetical protein